MTRCLLRLAAVTAILSIFVYAGRFEERWAYYSDSVAGDAKAAQKAISFLKQAKACGVTHVLIGENPAVGAEVPTDMIQNAKEVLASAKRMKITIVPGVYPIGYSGRFLGRYPDLAVGIPVRNARFVVRGRTVLPDDGYAPSLVNAGFEASSAGGIAGWTRQDLAGLHSMPDTTIKHAGTSSLKITDLDKLPKSAGGAVRVGQTLKVRPFHSYVLSVWVKSENLRAEGEDYVWLFSNGRQRRHSYTNLKVAGTQDWTRHSIIFDSLEADTIDISVGVTDAKRGTIWFDDLEIKPAGLTYLVRRPIAPFTVQSEDGKIAYKEGEDFVSPVTQPLSFQREVPVAPTLQLTAKSRLQEGQAILISYYHSTTIYNDQQLCSIQEPRVFALMEEQVQKTLKVWPAGSLFMNYDEIRIGGWELQPQGENLTLGQILARHVKRGVEIIQKQARQTKIYAWSDMFDPHHNAFPFDEPSFGKEKGFYYLCNGNWNGSWEGLPKDVVVMNWNGTENAARSLRWFAGRGHHQVLAGYYDGDPRENIEMWMKAAQGVPNVDGMMYTTWQSNFKRMPEFFDLLARLSSNRQ